MNNIKEQWLPIVGYDKYEVSNKGQVRNKKTGRILKQAYQNSGYTIVALRRDGKTKTYSIHRLVMETFEPRPDADHLDVNHKDWDKTNNNLDNLEWVTRKVNLLYGSGPNELKILESMLHNAIKAALHQWYNKLLSAKCTKECFTERVVEQAISDATKFYNETHQ